MHQDQAFKNITKFCLTFTAMTITRIAFLTKAVIRTFGVFTQGMRMTLILIRFALV